MKACIVLKILDDGTLLLYDCALRDRHIVDAKARHEMMSWIYQHYVALQKLQDPIVRKIVQREFYGVLVILDSKEVVS